MGNANLAQLKTTLVSDAPILAAVSGVGYINALLFEIGYLNFFGINYLAAEVTTRSFILFGITFLVLAMILLPHRALLTMIWSPKIFPKNPFLRLGFRVVHVTLLAGIFFLPLSIYYNYWFLLGFIPIMTVFFAIANTLVEGWGIKGMKYKVEHTLTAPVSEVSKKDRPIGLFLLGMLLLCTISLLLGKAFASTRSSYQVVEGKYLVVKQYSDRMILAEYTAPTNRLTGNYRYISMGDKSIDFHMTSIKKLQK